MPDVLPRLVKDILSSASTPMTIERLLIEIHDKGYRNVSRKHVTEYLSLAKALNVIREAQVPGRETNGWTLAPKRQTAPSAEPNPPAPPKIADQLYSWQTRAVSKWASHHHRGIVEAVTGSGKTMVALAAWEQLREHVRPLNTLIVVPTVELMRQWHDRFQRAFPERPMGLIGDGCRDDFSKAPICISVINCAVRHLDDLFAHLGRCPARTFLIADECHRYIDPVVFQRIRHFPFNYTLGLSATIDPFQVQGLGQIIYSYSFADAVRDGLVPEFDLVNTSVQLTSGERENYDELSEKIGDQIAFVKQLFAAELRDVRSEQFFRKLQAMLKRADGTNEPSIARLLGLIFKRAAISYTAKRKMQLAEELALTLLNEGHKKLIVFFERIRSAEELEEEFDAGTALDVETATSLKDSVLAAGNKWCHVLHSGLAREERRTLLDEFRQTKVAALLACRVLDEGLDVPGIDAALLVASTQSRRQRIQRIGRSLRKGTGKKRPLVITLHVPETTDANVTSDDPELFGTAARIHRTAAGACLSLVRDLLARDGNSHQPCAQ
jgi:superfamily II DNA or RNA helicase